MTGLLPSQRVLVAIAKPEARLRASATSVASAGGAEVSDLATRTPSA
jgi:hypothetical protein